MGVLTWRPGWKNELTEVESAGPEAARLALTVAGHHGEEDPRESARYEGVLEEEDRSFAVVVQLPRRAAAGRKGSGAGFGVRKGSVHPERKGSGRLDVEPAC